MSLFGFFSCFIIIFFCLFLSSNLIFLPFIWFLFLSLSLSLSSNVLVSTVHFRLTLMFVLLLEPLARTGFGKHGPVK